MATSLALRYAVISALWILFSGLILHRLVQDPYWLEILESCKGWLFVAVTALLLWLALDRYFRAIRESALRLHESEQRLRLIMEAAKMGTFDWDQATQRLVLSPWHEKLWGFRPGEFRGSADEFLNSIHPDDRSSVRATIQGCLRQGSTASQQFRVIWPDGSLHWIEAFAEFTLHEDSQPGHLRGAVVEITPRRQIEQEMQESLLLRREAEKIARIGAWKANPSTDYLYWTDGVYEILEAPLDYKPGLKEGISCYDRESVPILEEALRKALQDGQPFVVETGLTTMKGKHLFTEVRGLLRVGQGDDSYIVGTFQDITARKHAEDSLRSSEERLRLALGAASLGLYDLNLETGAAVVSQDYALMLGYDPETFQETITSWISRIHPDDRKLVERHFRECVEGRMGEFNLEFREQTRSGSWKWVASTSRIVMRDPFGRPLRMTGTQTDITDRKRAERKARLEAQRSELLLNLHQQAPHMTDRQLYDYVLDKAVQLTESSIGFFHLVSADQNNIILTTWNQEALKDCTATFDSHYPLREAGNWVECVRTQQPVVYNNYAESPNRQGLPPGHAPLTRFMSIPVIENGIVHIIFGVGNKPEDYEPADVTQLQLVANELHKIMMQRRVQNRLNQLSMAVEQSPASIVITNLAGAIEYVNPKFTQTTGYSLAEVQGRNPRVLKSGELPDQAYQQLWETISRGEQWRGEFHNKRKDGQLFWEIASISPIKDTHGRITHFIAVKEDITERKRLEAFRQALLALGVRLNRARDPVSASRALFDAADQLWDWDSAMLDLFSPDLRYARPILAVDIIDGQRRELALPATEVELTSRMQKVMREGAQLILREKTIGIETDARLFGDKTRLSASIMSVPIYRDAQPVGTLSIQSYAVNAYAEEDLKTLTALADYCGSALDRIRSEEALRHSEERYRGLVETTLDWIWETDLHTRYSYASPRIYDLLGYTPAEVLGRQPFDFMPAAEAKRVAEVWHDVIAERKPFSALENINLHRDGRPIVLESSGVPTWGPHGEFLGYRGMDRDVTERKRLEGELRQAQKLEAIGQLAGGVAHDFNNILAAIMMNLSLLQMNPDLDPEMRHGLTELNAEARRASSLTRQLLMFSRRSVLSIKPLDLNEVVANLLKMLSRLIGENIHLRFDGKPNLPLVEADAGMMEQVLMNLVVNARDSMPKGGRITIATLPAEISELRPPSEFSRRPGRFVCLSVSDTGCGMDSSTIKRIFEPFFTTKEAGRGTGLGLATVHGIVAQHKGWVEVESAPGEGANFRVFLPALDTRLDEAPSPIDTTPNLRRGEESILLVEDEEDVRKAIAMVLRGMGYRIVEASNGHEALRLWQVHGSEVKLLFTDMVMPEGMTGLELTEHLQALKPGLKAIISSGYSAEIVQAGIPNKAGIVYLAKPYEAQTLASTVRECLDRNT